MIIRDDRHLILGMCDKASCGTISGRPDLLEYRRTAGASRAVLLADTMTYSASYRRTAGARVLLAVHITLPGHSGVVLKSNCLPDVF